MTVTAWDPAATTTVEDNPSETLARRLRAHLQALAPIALTDHLSGGGQRATALASEHYCQSAKLVRILGYQANPAGAEGGMAPTKGILR